MTEEQRTEAFRHKEQMKALIEMPGWKLLTKAAEVQVVSRRNEVMMKPADHPLVQEFEKGRRDKRTNLRTSAHSGRSPYQIRYLKSSRRIQNRGL